MLKHTFRIFRSDLASWVPTMVVVALVTVLIGTCMNQFIWTNSDAFVDAANSAGLDPAEFGLVSVTIYLLVALLSIFALTVIGSATVERTRDTFAQWRLMGADPRQVRHSLWALVSIAAIAGALPGSLVSIGVSYLAVPVFNQMASESFPGGIGDFAPPAFQPSIAAWAGAFLLGVGTCVLGALVPSWRAARVEAVEAVREPVKARRRGAWVRWTIGSFLIMIALVIATGSVTAQQTADIGVDAGRMVNSAIMTGLVTALGVDALGAELVPAVLSASRRLLRHSLTPVGGLATRSARASSDRNANTIAPLAAAIGLGAVLMTAMRSYLRTMEAAGFSMPAPNYTDTFVMTGLFGVMALLTSVAVIALSSRDTVREQAMLRAAGMTPRQVTSLAAWQSLLLVICAAIFALVPVVFAGVVLTVRSALIVGAPILDFPWLAFASAALLCWIVLFLVQWLQLAPWLTRAPATALRRG